ncbi:MAG: DinB family protein [Acidobacteriota bacterium]
MGVPADDRTSDDRSGEFTGLGLLATSREWIAAKMENLSDRQLQAIPAGWNNNLLWQIGHLVVTQPIICYGLSGLPLPIDDEHLPQLRKGSSPADWTEPPDRAEIMRLFVELPRTFAADLEAGRFDGAVTDYRTAVGFEIRTLQEAIDFNGLHEGIHYGQIMALARLTS